MTLEAIVEKITSRLTSGVPCGQAQGRHPSTWRFAMRDLPCANDVRAATTSHALERKELWDESRTRDKASHCIVSMQIFG